MVNYTTDKQAATLYVLRHHLGFKIEDDRVRQIWVQLVGTAHGVHFPTMLAQLTQPTSEAEMRALNFAYDDATLAVQDNNITLPQALPGRPYPQVPDHPMPVAPTSVLPPDDAGTDDAHGDERESDDGNAETTVNAPTSYRPIRIMWSQDMRRVLILTWNYHNPHSVNWDLWTRVLQLLFPGYLFQVDGDELKKKAMPLMTEMKRTTEEARKTKWAQINPQPTDLPHHARRKKRELDRVRALVRAVLTHIMNAQGSSPRLCQAAQFAVGHSSFDAHTSSSNSGSSDDSIRGERHLPSAQIANELLARAATARPAPIPGRAVDPAARAYENDRSVALRNFINFWASGLATDDIVDLIPRMLDESFSQEWDADRLREIVPTEGHNLLNALRLFTQEGSRQQLRFAYRFRVEELFSSELSPLYHFEAVALAFGRDMEMVHGCLLNWVLDANGQPKAQISPNQGLDFIDHTDPVYVRGGKVYRILVVDTKGFEVGMDAMVCDPSYCDFCNPHVDLFNLPLGFPHPFVHRNNVAGANYAPRFPREPYPQAESVAGQAEIIFWDGAKRTVSVCTAGNCGRCG